MKDPVPKFIIGQKVKHASADPISGNRYIITAWGIMHESNDIKAIIYCIAGEKRISIAPRDEPFIRAFMSETELVALKE